MNVERVTTIVPSYLPSNEKYSVLKFVSSLSKCMTVSSFRLKLDWRENSIKLQGSTPPRKKDHLKKETNSWSMTGTHNLENEPHVYHNDSGRNCNYYVLPFRWIKRY